MLDLIAMSPTSPDLAALRRHYLFAGLEEEDFTTLTEKVSLVNLNKGDMLFMRGDIADSFFFVLAGQMELSLTTPTGEKKVLEVFGVERTFAEAITFMRRQRFPVNAQALRDTRLIRIPSQAYVSIIYDNPDACMRLLGDVCQHLHARVVEIERSTIQNARSRLVWYLLDKVGEISGDIATLELDLPRHVLASRLSIKPETLSRTLRTLLDENLLTVKERTIHIPSVNSLRNSA